MTTEPMYDVDIEFKPPSEAPSLSQHEKSINDDKPIDMNLQATVKVKEIKEESKD